MRILFSTRAFRSIKTAPTTQTAESTELPWAQSMSLRPIMVSPPWLPPNNTKNLILLQRNQYFFTKTYIKRSTVIMNFSYVCPFSFPRQEDCPCPSTRVATLWWQRNQCWFWVLERRNDLQDHPDDPVSLEARRQGRGGGGGHHTASGSPLDVVVGGKCRPLSAVDTLKRARGHH